MPGIKSLALSDAEHERHRKLFIPVRENRQSLIRTSPGNCLLPAAFDKYKEEIYNLQLRPEDVFVLTWPKNGSTWTQEMVLYIMNDCNFEKYQNINPLELERVLLLERGVLYDFCEPKIPGTSFYEIFSQIEAMPSPRLVRSHLPYCLLPPNLLDQCKVVTCLRNPKDAVVSFYHFAKLMNQFGFCGDFAEYFDLFMDDLVEYSPYWSYTLEAWQKRDHPNLCLLFFEDMKRDLEGNVRKVAKFLQKDLSEEQVKALVENLSFKKMKQNVVPSNEIVTKMLYKQDADGSANFFRKGEVGDWKNYFTEEMNKRMDDAIEKHCKSTGLEFIYE